MLPLDLLLKVMTADEAFARFIATLVTLGLPADKWRKGGALSTIVRVCAIMYAQFTVLLATIIASGFLETATGAGLTLLAWNVYGVQRRLAIRAREAITLTNTSGNLYEDQAPGSVIVFNEVTRKYYQNVDQFTLEPNSVLPGVIFEAVEAGSDSTSAAGAITGLETHLAGVTVVNPKAFVGLDDEQDSELRAACSSKLGSLSVRGPRTAYEWAIRAARLSDGVTPTGVNRWQISPSDSKGRVFIWIASPAGEPTDEDLEAVDESTEELARPDAVRKVLAKATPVAVTRALDVWVKRKPGVKVSDVKSTIETAYAKQGATYPVGGIRKGASTQGKLYSGWIEGVAKEAWPDTFDVDGAGDDQNINDGQVAQFAITVTVHLQEVA